MTGRTLRLSASVGVAFSTESTPSASSLVQQADHAMYVAKGRGGGLHVVEGVGAGRAPGTAGERSPPVVRPADTGARPPARA